jgi:HemK-like putative methylase
MTTMHMVRTAAFGGLRIAYDETVLSPRAWTQDQSLWVAELARSAPGGRILELCSGAGQIGLLAIAHCDRDLVAVDLSEEACRYAAANARAAGLADRVEIRHARLEAACSEGEAFPLMILDPPWVPARDTTRFPGDPLTAIDGGDDGLDVARACLEVVEGHLAPGGSAVLQVGSAEQVETLRAGLAPSLEITEVRLTPGRGALALLARRS